MSIRERRRKDGHTVYEVVCDIGADPVTGKRRQRTQTVTTGKRDAQSLDRQWRTDIARGVAIDRSLQSVADYLRWWMLSYVEGQRRPSTLDNYRTTVEKYLIPGLGATKLQKLTAPQVQQFYAETLAAFQSGVYGRRQGLRAARGMAGRRTVLLCHQRLRQALEDAVRLGLLARNVTDQVRPPTAPPREIEVWSEDEAHRFAAAALAHSSYAALWLVMVTTGLRKSECLGLRWRDLDLRAGTLRVQQAAVKSLIGPPKSARARRTVGLAPVVIEALRSHRQRQLERRLAHRQEAAQYRAEGQDVVDLWADNDLVWPDETGRPLPTWVLQRDYERTMQAAGVRRITIHELRKSVITLALDHGADLKAVSEHAGHSDVSVTLSRYRHVGSAQRAQVSRIIQEAVLDEHEPHGEQ